jgi:hypothetical protein
VEKFPSGVFEEKLANQGECNGKEIHEENHKVSKDGCSIGLKEQTFIRDEELELTHEPKAQREKNGERDEEGVSNHSGLLLAKNISNKTRLLT